jgi:hypothetical protein
LAVFRAISASKIKKLRKRRIETSIRLGMIIAS